ncbi:LacI family DNA-binding transcriptional regulator [Synoicihabitans lomoniglobus]|uniref:LacI family DNA-binding transcriptional regulator n=1 Tax=Synoicihabitans lomoniglobus TaxID=2909285 RepID=A0AAF0A1N7_9BACT|nr:LacI family transcriptional regulator [Opitutaceae bacterium LMO-M01]WED65197.1 LacI family DNA-binding transcriptional regulator [Opitutaceae bacterium LMO-M01]
MAKINQQYIAKELQISRATVSRCFTNHPGINPKTRAKVFALASRMGYAHTEKRTPAVHQRTRRALAFGVLVCVDLPNFDRTGYGNPGQELLNGLSEVARVQGVRLDLHFVRPEDLHIDGPSYEEIVSDGRRLWDGVVLIYPFPQSVVDELKATFPVVSLVEQYGRTPLDCVDVDHHRGIERLVEHLHSQGHRRIGFFTWRYPVEATWALRRYGAFVEMMTARGLEIDPQDAINVSPRDSLALPDAHARVRERTAQGVTAWICAADHQAFDLMLDLKAAGLRVPTDVSIVGFDGLQPPQGADKLTTIEIPFHQIGVTGGKRLLDLINKRFDSEQHILLNCDLRDGDTVAAPAKA